LIRILNVYVCISLEHTNGIELEENMGRYDEPSADEDIKGLLTANITRRKHIKRKSFSNLTQVEDCLEEYSTVFHC